MVGPFRFFVPRGVAINTNALTGLPRYTGGLKNSRTVLVSKPALQGVKIISGTTSCLGSTKVRISVFASIRTGPSIAAMRGTARTCGRSNTSFVMTLNKKSPVSITGTIKIATGCNKDVARCRKTRGIPKGVIPLVTVPAATKANSRIATFSIVASRDESCGLAMFDCRLLPTCTVLSPRLLASTPTSITTTYKVSTFVRTRRTCISATTSPFSSTVTRGTVRLVNKGVHHFITEHASLRTTRTVLAKSLFTKVTFSFTELKGIRTVDRPMDTFFGMTRKITGTILLPIVTRCGTLTSRNECLGVCGCVDPVPTCRSRFRPLVLISTVERLGRSVKVPRSLAATVHRTGGKRRVSSRRVRDGVSTVTSSTVGDKGVTMGPESSEGRSVIRLCRGTLWVRVGEGTMFCMVTANWRGMLVGGVYCCGGHTRALGSASGFEFRSLSQFWGMSTHYFFRGFPLCGLPSVGGSCVMLVGV